MEINKKKKHVKNVYVRYWDFFVDVYNESTKLQNLKACQWILCIKGSNEKYIYIYLFSFTLLLYCSIVTFLEEIVHVYQSKQNY